MSVDLKDVVVRYFFHPNTGKGIGCVVAVNTPEGIKMGWSQCNPKDNFNRKAARAIAIQRAIKPPTEPLKPATVKFKLFRPGESPFQEPKSQTISIENPLEPLIELVESVAKRAFGPRENPPIHDTADCNETCNHSVPTMEGADPEFVKAVEDYCEGKLTFEQFNEIAKKFEVPSDGSEFETNCHEQGTGEGIVVQFDGKGGVTVEDL